MFRHRSADSGAELHAISSADTPGSSVQPASPLIAYDLARLFVGPLFLTPRGIDRVDLALAKNIFADPRTRNVGILPMPWGTRVYSARTVRLLLDTVQRLWSEDRGVDDDPQMRRLLGEIAKPFAPRGEPFARQRLSLGRKITRSLGLLGAVKLPVGVPAARGVPFGATYINVGQLGLAVSPFHHWLAARPDVTCAMMLHDVIPLEYPHLVNAASVKHHARMVDTVAQRAHCLLFNTDYARRGIDAALRERGRVAVPSLVRALPLPGSFADAGESPAALADQHYFLVVSTIEPRKNHALLLRVWERLVAKRGHAAPHLVIVGSPGFGADAILARLEDKPLLRSRVHIVSGLSSAALASLTIGASAMLCPTLVEGFGLPLFEANAVGTPAIVSDIAAHREIAREQTQLLAPDDEDAWERAILAAAPVGHRRRPPIDLALSEDAYCRDVIAFVSSVSAARRAPSTNVAADRAFEPRLADDRAILSA